MLKALYNYYVNNPFVWISSSLFEYVLTNPLPILPALLGRSIYPKIFTILPELNGLKPVIIQLLTYYALQPIWPPSPVKDFN